MSEPHTHYVDASRRCTTCGRTDREIVTGQPQPVTPDREALAREMVRHYPVYGGDTARCGCGWTGMEGDRQAHLLDALLPLLTEVLDRARQQGKREGREEAAQEWYRERMGNWSAREPECSCGYGGFHEPENPRCEINRARVARGGPNRKDEE